MTQVINYGADARAVDAGQGVFARFGKALADYRLYRATVEELEQLNDRDLADLGLHRADLRAIARESVYGR